MAKGPVLTGVTLNTTDSAVKDIENLCAKDAKSKLNAGDQEWLEGVLERLSTSTKMDGLRSRIKLLLEKHGNKPQ